MKRRLFGFLTAGVLIFTSTVLPLRAQLVSDGATNTINNITNIIADDVTVGTNGSFTLLVLTNNALLTNFGHGYVGRNVGANTNTVRLAGPNTRWTPSGELFVGRDGVGNQLVLSNSSVVRDLNGYVGYNPTSISNRVVVTGAGSLWTNELDAFVGFLGARNQLLVTNGGVVRSSSGFLGYFSTGNSAVVTGVGSVWTNQGLAVGYNGGSNQLVMTNGGVVQDTDGFLGYGSSDGNAVLVVGAGSLWANSTGLYVGFSGAKNQLVVSNGGAVYDYIGYIGRNPTSRSNLAVVTGAGSLWTNSEGLNVGYEGAGNQLVVTNSGVVWNPIGAIGESSTSSNNVALVTGAGSLWRSLAVLWVGRSGAGNQLVVSNGGVMESGMGYIGRESTSSNNAVLVTGAGSLWTNGSGLIVGYEGMGNKLVVSNGGAVRNITGWLGYFSPGSSNNAAVVTGAGSQWVNAFELNVGDGGGSNQLMVSAGGFVRNKVGFIGRGPDSPNNVVVVTGVSSLWTNEADLAVGYQSAGNQLVVSDGGVVRSDGAFLGSGPTSVNNLALVTGAGSLWAPSHISVGGFGAGNQLVVSDGGVVRNGNGFVGSWSTTSNNTVTVTGVGSLWTNSNDLGLGIEGAGNQLVVSNGAVVWSHDGYLGSSSSNNAAVVTGAGSRWENQGVLIVGVGGAVNQVVVTNGGAVRNDRGFLGSSPASSNNLAVVTGSGSQWTNGSTLVVGDYGAGNQLVVTNGGVVRDYAGFLGSASTSSGNAALVTGAGSLWTNASVLAVGVDGSGNQLNVRNGGVVRNTIGYIGSNSISVNNSVIVRGAGSLWTNASAVFVGYFGSFNQLVVNNSGKVHVAGPVTLGYGVGATNNSVQVSGGSIASVGLTLGNLQSRNNSIALLSGSVWDVGGGPFIWGNAGNNDTLTIDPTSTLTNIGSLTLDEHATPFFLTNAPGGYTLNGFTTNQFQFKTNGLGALIVGYDGTNVQLTISNSTLISTTASIGDNATALSNLVLVTGAGTVWSNSGALNIGNLGSFSRLVVSNGGAVRAGGLITLGKAAGSTNNSVLAVSGSLSSVGLTLGNVQSRNNSVTLLSGSTWDVGGGAFTWGNAGINDTLSIDGTSSLTNIGALTLDENNTANLLTNSSSLNGMNVGFKTSGLGALVVGNAGTNVSLTISNFNWAGTSGDIGLGATSQSNSVFLSGVSSAWSNTGNLFVGNGGAFNSLVISAGAVAASASGTVGNNATSISNSVFVTGATSMWSNSGALTIGNSGAFNRLVISNAARVLASNVVVGFNSSASNNFLLLSAGAQLTNGGDGVLGWNTGANANSAFVSGTNSRWQVGNSLYVGSNGAFNQLVISNAGTLIAGPNLSVFTGGGVFVGANPGASNNSLSLSSGAQMTNGGYIALGWSLGANSNTVSVSGPNTRWQLLQYAYLYVGNSGAFNRLVISNGAQVKQTGNTVVNIGFNSSAINNEVVVTGTNSLWTMDDLTVGLFGGGSHLVISDGARVENGSGWIGPSNSSPPSPVSNNVALVTGANSRWTMTSGLVVGNSGSGSLVISNGGGVNNFAGIIGTGIYGNNNSAVVTGANSYWSNEVSLYVGQAGSGCSLVISNGAWVDDTSGSIGLQTVGETNEVVVTGAGSVWNNRSDLYVGNDGVGNRLLITDGGKVFVANKAYVGFGFNPVSSNNLLTVSGGSLIVTNLAVSAFLDVRYGTNVLNAGLIEADRLVLTNASARGGGWFNFNGGTFKTRGTTNNNGRLFAVGNGTSPAAFELAGNGLHTFTDGLAISNNATLRGNGSINGTLAVAVGGALSPGTSIGKIVLSNSPVLLGNVIMEISRNGAALTNDQVQVAGPLTYGGSLIVSNLGPNALTTGNSFQLFSASGYGGAFTTVNLPALNAGLFWTNKLLVNGSIEVIGVALPQFEKIGVSGTNVIVSGTNGIAGTNYAVLTATNIILPLSNWVSLMTNQFGAGGGFSFTNGITPGDSQRYFRLRTP